MGLKRGEPGFDVYMADLEEAFQKAGIAINSETAEKDLSRIMVYDPANKEKGLTPLTEHLEGHDMEDITEKMTDLATKGASFYAYERGASYPKQIKMIDRNGPDLSSKTVNDAPKMAEPKMPGRWARFTHFVSAGYFSHDEITSYAAKKKAYDEQQHVRQLTEEKVPERKKTGAREMRDLERMEQSRNEKKAVKNLDDNVMEAERGRKAAESLFAPRAKAPEGMRRPRVVETRVYVMPEGMSLQECILIANMICSSRSALTSGRGNRRSEFSLQRVDKDREFAQNFGDLHKNLISNGDTKNQENLNAAIARGREATAKAFAAYNAGRTQTMGKWMGDGAKNMAQAWRGSTPIRSVYGFYLADRLGNTLRCLDAHPELKKSAGLTDQDVKSMRGMANISECMKAGLYAERELIVDPPEAGSAEREVLLKKALAGRIIDKRHEKDMLPERQKVNDKIKEAVDAVKGDKNDEAYFGFKYRKDLPNSKTMMEAGENPKEYMKNLMKEVADSKEFKDLMQMSPKEMKEALIKNGAFDFEKSSAKVMKESHVKEHQEQKTRERSASVSLPNKGREM